MPGRLDGDRVILSDQGEASRLINRGRYGRPLSGGGVQLDLIEAAYLVEAERLDIKHKGKALSWAELVVEASRAQGGFEVLYLVYRDLRERGFLTQRTAERDQAQGAHFRTWPRGTQKPEKADAWVRAVSERSRFEAKPLAAFVDASKAASCQPRLAVVDEESDLTYYELGADAPAGHQSAKGATKARGVLLADRILVADPEEAKGLYEDGFYGRPVSKGLQLSLVEACYLAGEGRLGLVDANGKNVAAAALRKRAKEVEPALELRLRVYEDLRARGLIVKTGFKFGTHFRAYEAKPDEAHAPYLVQAVPADWVTEWEPLARAIRLSHSVRKKFYLGLVEGSKVGYISFGRFRP